MEKVTFAAVAFDKPMVNVVDWAMLLLVNEVVESVALLSVGVVMLLAVSFALLQLNVTVINKAIAGMIDFFMLFFKVSGQLFLRVTIVLC